MVLQVLAPGASPVPLEPATPRGRHQHLDPSSARRRPRSQLAAGAVARAASGAAVAVRAELEFISAAASAASAAVISASRRATRRAISASAAAASAARPSRSAAAFTRASRVVSSGCSTSLAGVVEALRATHQSRIVTPGCTTPLAGAVSGCTIPPGRSRRTCGLGHSCSRRAPASPLAGIGRAPDINVNPPRFADASGRASLFPVEIQAAASL